MDINKLATRVTKLEGGKDEISIAQTKEVIRCVNEQLKTDTNGNFVLYDLIHSFTEPGE